MDMGASEIAIMGMMAASSAMAASSSVSQANNQKRQQDYIAQQERVQAGQDVAVAQRNAMSQDRQTALVQSKLLAGAAASGAGATDETVVKNQEEIAEEGSYRAQTAMFNGQSQAAGLESQANLAQWQGDQAEQAGLMKAFGTVLSTGSSLYSRFNPNGGGDDGSAGSGSGQSLTSGSYNSNTSKINYDSQMEGSGMATKGFTYG